MASQTFYPDADPETSSVDGWAKHNDESGITWSALQGAAGNDSSDSGPFASPSISTHGVDSDKFTNLDAVYTNPFTYLSGTKKQMGDGTLFYPGHQ